MTNFLESIGRTNALGNAGKSLLDTAIALRGMKTNEATAAANIEMARARNAREEQVSNIQLAEETRKKAEYDQQEQMLNAVVPIDSIVGKLGPSAQKRLVDLAGSNNWIQEIGGVKVISNRNKVAATEMLRGNYSIQKQIAEDELMDVNNQMQEITNAMNDPETKMKDKDKAAAQQQLGVLKQKQVQMLNAINILDPEIRKAMALAETKDTNRIKPDEVFGAALNKMASGEKLSPGEEQVMALYKQSHNNTDAKDPATVATMKFMVDNNIAGSFPEAFNMLGESKTKTKEEFLMDVRGRIASNPMDIRSEDEISGAIHNLGEWYDKNVKPSRRDVMPQLPLKDKKGKALPDGTVINGPNGEQFILKGGKWQSK